MHRKLSLVVLNPSGRQISRIQISLLTVLLLIFLLSSGVTLLSYSAYDYYRQRASIATLGQFARQVVVQRDEIAQQRQQIQAFASEIDSLKNKLLALNEFEEKIRVIANLEPGQGEEGLFGIGGVTPEDLDPQLGLGQEHEELMREMHQQINDLDTASGRQTNRFGALIDKLEQRRNLLASTPAIRPTGGWLTSRFGHRTSPFTGRKEFHKGLDIANRKGTQILATANGVITFVGRKSHMGKVVVIDHGHGMLTRYAHLDEAMKKRGDKVNRGDVIALMGNSGRSTGPHLHYEVHLNGVPVNPEKYILN